MRVVWFSHFIPFPPRGGAYQRSFNLIRQISRTCRISFVAFNPEKRSNRLLAEHGAELRKYCESVEFWELPLPWKGLEWWAQLLWSPFYRGPYHCRAFWSLEVEATWQRMLERYEGALLHFDSSELALFAGAAQGFRKVLNHHNCESAMAHRRAQREGNLLKKAYLYNQARKLEQLEREFCPFFDVNTTVSELDAETLQTISPKAHFHVVENGTDTEYFVPSQGPGESNSIILASSLYWYPNISAIQLFVRDIWPLIKRQRPGVRLYVAGQRPPASLVRWLERDPDIVVVANPDDIRPWLARAAVFVCAMVDGGGTKVKILDAMAMGKAVVSTSVGCEGLRVKHEENIVIADTPEAFAGAVLRVLENSDLCTQLGVAGRSLVEKVYSWEVIGSRLERAYRCALSRGACQREPNMRVGETA